MSKSRFFICARCGNIVNIVRNGGGSLVCCGEKMKELIPGEVEASAEKHLPVVSLEGGVLHAFVGEAEHPMTEAHNIAWIYLETEKGGEIKYISPDGKPEAFFNIGEDKPVAVFAYCNLHGLWKIEI